MVPQTVYQHGRRLYRQPIVYLKRGDLTKNIHRLLFFFFTSLFLALSFSLPAFAITESEVEAQINTYGRESVTGNVLIWFLCAVGFLKVSQKIDSFLTSLGVNVGHTGGSMLAETMIAVRSATLLAGGAGKVLGSLGHTAGSATPSGAAGASWAFKGGLAGMISRKVSSSAVKTATTRTQAASSHVAHSASDSHTTASVYSSNSAHSEQVRDRWGAVQQQSSTRQHTASSHSSAQRQTESKTAAFSRAVTRVSSIRQASLGGAMFTRSLLSGGKFANDVISKVASGDMRSTGSIKGDLATQALLSYTGITALGDQIDHVPVYKDVEIGGGRITGTELTKEFPKGISFAMYHADQFTKPDGQFQPVHTADGQLWYKQYAEPSVTKTPYRAPDGDVDYHKDIVRKLPNPPKRKDRI